MKDKSLLGLKGYKKGTIIYPHKNGSLSIFKKTRWDLIVSLNKDKEVDHVAHIYQYSTVRAIELIQQLRG